MKVDAHVHFWGHSELQIYEWMSDDMTAIRKPFGPENLRPHLTSHGIDSVVLVQTYSSTEETRRYLALANEVGFIGGVVGWVDLTSPGVAEDIAALQEGPEGHYLVGIRHQVHDEDDPEWLLRPDVRRGLHAIGESGLVYDILVRTRELPAALIAARSAPHIRFVIDHIAKPPIASRQIEPWAERMAPFAALDHVACKLSGMITEAGWGGWRPDDILPYVKRVLEWFEEDRLLFGSDWPVCTLAGSYDDVVETLEYGLGPIAEGVHSGIFGDNAADVYRLPSDES